MPVPKFILTVFVYIYTNITNDNQLNGPLTAWYRIWYRIRYRIIIPTRLPDLGFLHD